MLKDDRARILQLLNDTEKQDKLKRLRELEADYEIQSRNKQHALEEGDLRENAAYTLACQSLQRIGSERAIVEDWLDALEQFNNEHEESDIIGLGTVVRITYRGGDKVILIVPSELGNAAIDAISVKSAVGASLLGKQVGDTITVMSGAKTHTYKVLEVY